MGQSSFSQAGGQLKLNRLSDHEQQRGKLLLPVAHVSGMRSCSLWPRVSCWRRDTMLSGQAPGVVGLGLCVDARRAGSHPTRDGLRGCAAARVQARSQAKGTAGRGYLSGGVTRCSFHLPRALCPLRGCGATNCPLSICFANLKPVSLPEGRIPTLLAAQQLCPAWFWVELCFLNTKI